MSKRSRCLSVVLVTTALVLVLLVGTRDGLRVRILTAIREPWTWVAGDEGDADFSILIAKYGGRGGRDYLLKRLDVYAEGYGNDVELYGMIDGLIANGDPSSACTIARTLLRIPRTPKSRYLFVIFGYAIQEIGQVAFAERVPYSDTRPPDNEDAYKKFCVNDSWCAGEELTQGRARFQRLVHSIDEWWKEGGLVRLPNGRQVLCAGESSSG